MRGPSFPSLRRLSNLLQFFAQFPAGKQVADVAIEKLALRFRVGETFGNIGWNIGITITTTAWEQEVQLASGLDIPGTCDSLIDHGCLTHIKANRFIAAKFFSIGKNHSKNSQMETIRSALPKAIP